MTRAFTGSLLAIAASAAVAGCTVRMSDEPDAPVAMDAPVVFDDVPFVIPDAPDASAVCDTREINCSGRCVRVVSDNENCGSCGTVCPAGTSCALGECGCLAPMQGCGGLCIDPMTDEANCGECGVACAGTEMCVDGECRCSDADDGRCFDAAAGREACTDLLTDNLNCGTCGRECTGPTSCSGGRCLCADGSEACDGVCLDLSTDNTNCGSCGTVCVGTTTCVAGVCTCPGGGAVCSTGCTDLATDPLNCGACLTSCGADGTCAAGRCTTCGTGLTSCGTPARCVNTMTSRIHCGMCGRVCPAGNACVDGVCQCVAGEMDCGTGCTDPRYDENNCGGCGIDCGAGGVCNLGTCACMAPLTLCGASCRNTDTDVANCGGCGVPCTLVGGVCTGGVCGCPPGQMNCGGTCRDVLTDGANCGMCGMACTAPAVCVGGTCNVEPTTRYRLETPAPALVPFVDACAAPGHTTFAVSGDDESTLTPLPFDFRFWTTDLTAGANLWVSANGFLTMDGVSSTVRAGTIPGTAIPNSVVAPLWSDFRTRTNGVCIATVGTAPRRQLVIEWSDAYYRLVTTSHLTFEVIFTEDTRTIDFVYGTMDPAGPSVGAPGIENQTGSMGVNPCAATAGRCTPATSTVYRFTPIP